MNLKKVLVKIEYEASISDHWTPESVRKEILRTGNLPPVVRVREVEIEEVVL